MDATPADRAKNTPAFWVGGSGKAEDRPGLPDPARDSRTQRESALASTPWESQDLLSQGAAGLVSLPRLVARKARAPQTKSLCQTSLDSRNCKTGEATQRPRQATRGNAEPRTTNRILAAGAGHSGCDAKTRPVSVTGLDATPAEWHIPLLSCFQGGVGGESRNRPGLPDPARVSPGFYSPGNTKTCRADVGQAWFPSPDL
jgi:hypothetical protein